MRVRVAAIAGAILLACGGAKDSGGGASSPTTPPAPPASTTVAAAPSAGAPAASAPPDTPAAPPDAPAATPSETPDAGGPAPAPAPPDNTPAPAPSPDAPKWAGTQTFAAPWTEVDRVATLPGGGFLAFGNQFLIKDGRGSRYGSVAWIDASGTMQRVLTHPNPDDIFAMAVSVSGAIALGGYTQGGEGGYLLLLDAEGTQKWAVPLGYHGAIYGVTFAPNGDVVACGSDPDSFIGRWAPDGTQVWRKTYPVASDGFAYGIALTPSGDIAAAGGRGPVFALLVDADGATLWTRSFDLGTQSTSGGGIAVDAQGAVLLSGRRDGNDAFVMKLDPAGETSWQKTIATSGVDTANGIAVDAAGNAVVVGSYGLASGGGGTGYVARFDPSGEQLWMTDVDWPGIEVLRGIALDAAGNAYVVGSYPSDALGFHTQGFLVRVDRAGIVQ